MTDREEGAAQVRIDKWLWAARFFKTRSLAQEAVELGRVRVRGDRVKSSRIVQVGDELSVERGGERMIVTVRGLSDVRGPASEAQKLYEETPASKSLREQAKAARRLATEPAAYISRGRPTKRDARRLREFQSGWESWED